MPELIDGFKRAQRLRRLPCKLAAACFMTASNMGVVSRPVFVFCREQ
jgi:hypothetical protein